MTLDSAANRKVEGEREGERVEKTALKFIYSRTIFVPVGTCSSSLLPRLLSRLYHTACDKNWEEEPRNCVLTSPGLNLRVPDVAVKCVPATAGSKVN